MNFIRPIYKTALRPIQIHIAKPTSPSPALRLYYHSFRIPNNRIDRNNSSDNHYTNKTPQFVQPTPNRFIHITPTNTSTSTAQTMTHFKIDITSDILCPWCYIGHARLTRAITAHQASHPNDTFALTYHPFYLAPPPPQTQSQSPSAFPVESKPRIEHYTAKFGPQRAPMIFQTLARAAASEGLNFKFGGMTGHSRNGHRLVHYAQRHSTSSSSTGAGAVVDEGAQNRVMLRLWRAYFESETDITELEVLVKIGVDSGLGDEATIREYLLSGKDGDVVDEKAEEARRGGEVSGVPFYVVQDYFAVSGAQEPGVFQGVFGRVKSMEGKGVEGNGGVGGVKDACGIDDREGC